MSEFNHFDESGNVHMVDVGNKPTSKRQAIATGYIEMRKETLQMVVEGQHKKGDVLAVARIAAIMASKRTADIIPLCHPIPLTHVAVDLVPEMEKLRIRCHCTIETNAQTGIEMEALHATQVALLTIYDMCKGVDRGMCMGGIRLLRKTGGKSGTWEEPSDHSND